MLHTIRRGGLLFATVFAWSAASGASFPCAKASTASEKLICLDSVLSKLDSELAKDYRDQLANAVSTEQLVADQRTWITKVRDRCTTSICMQAAYLERRRVLFGTVASFDCLAATSEVEKLICSEEGLRYADRRVASAFSAVRDISMDPEADRAQQKAWLQNVRDTCTDVKCLSSVLSARAEALYKQQSENMERLRAKIGYRKPAFYTDTMPWPNDPKRMIVVFATQESATNEENASPQQDKDFVLDLYVLDTRTRRVLQHGTDSASSDAIALGGASIDRRDYSKQLGVPAFGLQLSYGHSGCAGYEGTVLRLFEPDGHGVRSILPALTLDSRSSMCGTECESSSSSRTLQAAAGKGARHPDLIVREQKVEMSSLPKEGSCKSTRSKSEHRLSFKNDAYVVPTELAY